MDMVQTYKLLNSESGEHIFERADIRRETRADNLLKKRSIHEFRSNFYSMRVIGDWNSLPNAVKEAGTAKNL